MVVCSSPSVQDRRWHRGTIESGLGHAIKVVLHHLAHVRRLRRDGDDQRRGRDRPPNGVRDPWIFIAEELAQALGQRYDLALGANSNMASNDDVDELVE